MGRSSLFFNEFVGFSYPNPQSKQQGLVSGAVPHGHEINRGATKGATLLVGSLPVRV